MKFSSISKFVIVLLPLFLAAGPADLSPNGDLGKLQGDWTVKAGPKRDIPVILKVKGNEVTVDVDSPLGLKIHAEGKLKIDDSTTPKTIDWLGFSIVDGQEFPDIFGIYELKEDSFRLVNGGPNDKRPKEFKKGDGALADVLTFSRAKANLAQTRK